MAHTVPQKDSLTNRMPRKNTNKKTNNGKERKEGGKRSGVILYLDL